MFKDNLYMGIIFLPVQTFIGKGNEGALGTDILYFTVNNINIRLPIRTTSPGTAIKKALISG